MAKVFLLMRTTNETIGPASVVVQAVYALEGDAEKAKTDSVRSAIRHGYLVEGHYGERDDNDAPYDLSFEVVPYEVR